MVSQMFELNIENMDCAQLTSQSKQKQKITYIHASSWDKNDTVSVADSVLTLLRALVLNTDLAKVTGQ